MDESDPRRGFFKNVFNMFDVRDVVDDVSSNSASFMGKVNCFFQVILKME